MAKNVCSRWCFILAYIVLGRLYCQALENDEPRALQAVTLYVSLAGNDHWSGTLPQPNKARTDGPLATVNQAAVLSKDHKQEAVTVIIEPGVYYLQQTLTLDATYSRLADAPLTFSGCPSANNHHHTELSEVSRKFPVLSGGIKLMNYSRLDMGNYIAFLPEDHADLNVTQLFVNGQREPVARKPNEGYLYWKSPLEPCNKLPDGFDDWRAAVRDSACPDIDRYGFVFNEGDISKSWTNTDEIWISVFAAWTATWHHIKSIDFNNNTVMFVEPSNYAVGDFLAPSGKRYYVENVAEELDAPGEWILNRKKGFIEYQPRSTEYGDLEFVVPYLQSVISVSGAENINFECLSVQHSLEGPDNRQAYHTTEAAVYISNSSHITLSKIDVQHTGACGIFLDNHCDNVNVDMSRTADCGGDGISLHQDSTNIMVQNTIVNTTGFIYMMQPTGIRVQGQRNITIQHNEVLNVPYAAIMIGWQAGYQWVPPSSADHYVFNARYNHVHHYGLGILSDFGGIYVSALVSCWLPPPGTKPASCNMAARVEQNIMHTAQCYNYGADGFYTDEDAGGTDLVSNLIYDVESAGIYFHCGVNLTSMNNFVINADIGGHRGAFAGCNMGGFSKHLPLDATYRHNIVYILSNQSHFSTPNTQLDNSTFNYNLYFDTSGPLVFPGNMDFQHWQSSGQDKESKIADPKFKSVETRDFHLLPDSPAHSLGITPIDIETVGPQSNPFTLHNMPAWTPLVPLKKKTKA